MYAIKIENYSKDLLEIFHSNIDNNIKITENRVQSILSLYLDFLKGGWLIDDTKELLRLLEDLQADCKTEQIKTVLDIPILKVRKHLEALESDNAKIIVGMFEGIGV